MSSTSSKHWDLPHFVFLINPRNSTQRSLVHCDTEQFLAFEYLPEFKWIRSIYMHRKSKSSTCSTYEILSVQPSQLEIQIATSKYNLKFQTCFNFLISSNFSPITPKQALLHLNGRRDLFSAFLPLIGRHTLLPDLHCFKTCLPQVRVTRWNLCGVASSDAIARTIFLLTNSEFLDTCVMIPSIFRTFFLSFFWQSLHLVCWNRRVVIMDTNSFRFYVKVYPALF